jgi:hypothetical protein
VLGAAVLISIDSHVKVPSQWAYWSSTASTVLSAIVGAEAALTGLRGDRHDAGGADGERFVLGAVHAALVPRPVLKGVLALLIGTLAYSFRASAPTGGGRRAGRERDAREPGR